MVPSASIGASAQLRPWLPPASAGLRFTGASPGSSTLVNDGMYAPTLSATSRARRSATGSTAPAGHSCAAICTALRRRKPAPSRAPAASISGSCSTVPAASVCPESVVTAAPSTVPAGSRRFCEITIGAGSTVPTGSVTDSTGTS